MDSDVPDPTVHEEEASPDERVDGSCANKKKRGRVPKRMLKAEREKMKREQLNDLFSNLACALELSEPNNGKACILGEAIRLVNDMTSQIKCLREENTTLLSESHYVTMEKNELKDENSALESQILKIQSKIEERASQLKPDLNVAPPECWQQAQPAPDPVQDPAAALQPMDPTAQQQQQQPILGPLYVIPIGQNIQADMTTSKVPSHVMKPHARYPAPGDSWPLQLLREQPETEATS